MKRYLVLISGYPDRIHLLCEGEDPQHAKEQAEFAYPEGAFYDLFELLPIELQEETIAPARERHICGWLNLTTAEWLAIPHSVKDKLWDYVRSQQPSATRNPHAD
jgi:hypothetical protein